MPIKKIIPFLLLFLTVFILYRQNIVNTQQSITLLITGCTAIFWVTEWLPIPVASLLPIALFPLF
ncbi:MAG: hypothetical protein KDI92_06135, partial [Xanthomonadales bacterium]|nr:hypothetical protein [Xanthomonadales bacterium]